jgi:hypothetical protein
MAGVTCFVHHASALTAAFSSWVIPVQPWGFAAISAAFEKFGKAWTLYKRRLDGDAAEEQLRVLELKREEEAAAAAAGGDVCVLFVGWRCILSAGLCRLRNSPYKIKRKYTL